jgi:DNA polymerase-1
VSIEEAEEFFRKYRTRHPKLFRWIAEIQKRAMRRGIAYTAFGRPRRLYHYFMNPSWKIKAFAKRSATNTTVQGTGADIFRIAFVRLFKSVFDVVPDKTRFQMAVHDEIDWLCRKDSPEMIDKVLDIMRLKRKDWPVPMDVGLEVGTSWGDLVEFKKVDGVWTPKGVES